MYIILCIFFLSAGTALGNSVLATSCVLAVGRQGGEVTCAPWLIILHIPVEDCRVWVFKVWPERFNINTRKPKFPSVSPRIFNF